MKEIQVSVITVVYNDENRIEKTIQSIIEQNYPYIESILIDGGSKDHSIDIIKKYQGRLSFWISEPDRGIYHAMNKGIQKATGEWLIFLNSGDMFHDPDVLSSLNFQVPQNIIIGKTLYINENGKTSLHSPRKNRFVLLLGNTFCHQSTLVRKHRQENFREDYPILADYYQWLKWIYIQKEEALFVDRVISIYPNTGESSFDTPRRRKVELQIKKELTFIGYLLAWIKISIYEYASFLIPIVHKWTFRSKGESREPKNKRN